MKSRRIFVTGDTHVRHDIQKLDKENFTAGEALCKDDILIICGDAGIVWLNEEKDRELIAWYDSRPWATVYCDGNHEGFTRLQEYPVTDFHGARAHRLGMSVYHILRGEIMELENGSTFLFFGGAFSQDIDFRTKNYDWFEAELPVQREVDNCMNNLKRYGFSVDYCITHDVPTRFNLQMGYRGATPYMLSDYGPEYINIHAVLDNIYEMTAFRKWFAGHYHINRLMYGKAPLHVLYDEIIELTENESQ